MGNTSKSKTKIIIQFLNLGNGDFLTLLIFFSPAISSLEGAVTRALWSAPSVLSPAPCSRARPGSGRHQSHRPARTDRLSPVLWTGTLTFVVLKTLINSDQECELIAICKHLLADFLGSRWGLSEALTHRRE